MAIAVVTPIAGTSPKPVQTSASTGDSKAVSSASTEAAFPQKTVSQGEIKSVEYVEPAPKPAPAPINYALAGSGFLGAPDWVVSIVNNVSTKTGVPASLMIAQLKQESGFNPTRVSATNDYGIAQIHMPKAGVSIEQAFNPSFAINWQGSDMIGYFQSYGSWRTALAAYNAGPVGMQRGYGYAYADRILSMAGI